MLSNIVMPGVSSTKNVRANISVNVRWGERGMEERGDDSPQILAFTPSQRLLECFSGELRH